MAETRRNEAQDPYGDPLGQHPDAVGGSTRNRPAAGAREVNSPQAADDGWQAGAGATDFLGLESDLRGGSTPNTDGGPTESWLFDIEQADAHMSPTAVATAAPARTEYAEYAENALADTEIEAEAGAEYAESLELEPEPEAAPPARRGSKRMLATVAVLALATAGGYYGWQRFAPGSPPTQQVASTTPEPTPAKSPAKPAPVTAPTPTVAAVPPIPETAPPAVTAPAVVEPVLELAATPVETNVPPRAEPLPDTAVASAPATDAPLERSLNPTPKSLELPTGRPGPGGGRHATDLDWAGMWLEPTIPNDAIRGPARLRTLNVGLVRAELVNGEFVEGTLYAVGESRVWLDVKLGRLSFDASDLRGLVQIVGAQGQPLPLGSQSLAGLPRVEVLLPGGSLTGRVLGREGDMVTFVTEDGMRMRVEAIDVRPAPTGRSRLIGPVAGRKP